MNVKNDGSERMWVKKTPRDNGEVWEEDDVLRLKGVRKKTKEKLEKAGILLVKHLKYLDNTDETMQGLCEATKTNGRNGLTISFLRNLVDQCRDAAEGAAPEKVDHRKAINPYESRFGTKWMNKIQQSAHMKKYVSIRSLVLHMYTATKQAFSGTQHENDFLFYHDALSLMTSRETIEWMADQNILQHWILPQQSLNKGTQYENAPPGNVPELNALDSNCNRDIHCAVLEHVAMTANMDKEDTRKFSVNSPLRQDDAYLRLWDPSL